MSRNRARNIPEMETKRANPDNPAVDHVTESVNGRQAKNTHRARC
jgi:hypothetical protein